MLIKDALLSIANYPIPESVIENIADSRGLDLTGLTTGSVRSFDNYRLAEADIMVWVAFAPNITEGGISFDMLYSDRKELRERANLVYKELNDPKYQSMIRQTFTFTGDEV